MLGKMALFDLIAMSNFQRNVSPHSTPSTRLPQRLRSENASQLSWRPSKPQTKAIGCNDRGHTHGKAAFDGNVHSKPQTARDSGKLTQTPDRNGSPWFSYPCLQVKLRSLLAGLKSKLFGKMHYMLHVIEYHGRGCAHAHIIIKFEGPSPEQLKELTNGYGQIFQMLAMQTASCSKTSSSTSSIKNVVRPTLLHPA